MNLSHETHRPNLAGQIATWISFVPLLSLFGLLALFALARIRLGAWPKAMHWGPGEVFPTHSNLDPAHLGVLYEWTLIGIAGSALLGALTIGHACLAGKSLRPSAQRILIGSSAILLIVLTNPFDLWNWYLD